MWHAIRTRQKMTLAVLCELCSPLILNMKELLNFVEHPSLPGAALRFPPLEIFNTILSIDNHCHVNGFKEKSFVLFPTSSF